MNEYPAVFVTPCFTLLFCMFTILITELLAGWGDYKYAQVAT